MFVQVIQGNVTDAGEAREAFDRWQVELSPGAPGWLGTTAGVAPDSHFFAAIRFETEEQSRANAGRPEQQAWWAQLSTLFTSGPTVKDSVQADVDVQGDPDSAGFVQIIGGRSSDPAKTRQLWLRDAQAWADFRPDVIASVLIQHEDGEDTSILYFTSEADARDGEKKEMPATLQQQGEEMMALSAGEPSFMDLKAAWLYGAS